MVGRDSAIMGTPCSAAADVPGSGGNSGAQESQGIHTKHLALRSLSVHSDKPYTCTGLGDRIHSCTLAWAYGQGEPVTLHLTQDKIIGGQYGNKPESWREILSLFPKESIRIQVHPIKGLSEPDWIRYLGKQGIKASRHYYSDHAIEQPQELDVSQYLKDFPLLTAAQQDIDLPDRFITMQWDATGPSRRINDQRRVVSQYQDAGLCPITIGGEAKTQELRWSLKSIAYAISRAEKHIGVDSAFMHLAMLYKHCAEIDVYAKPDSVMSHHMRRAIANGSTLNRH
jgi:hypothetical protein